MISSKPNEKLRNFQFPNELYYDLEWMGDSEKRNAKDQLIYILEEYREKFMEEHNLKKMPRTERRKEKLLQGKM